MAVVQYFRRATVDIGIDCFQIPSADSIAVVMTAAVVVVVMAVAAAAAVRDHGCECV